ncbi:MAG TPA: hypothetical protein VG733_08680 [Chthoniobacteraceae bacterium]|nr:hypothetical protein [Chthoniobacteraceae bacterium]
MKISRFVVFIFLTILFSPWGFGEDEKAPVPGSPETIVSLLRRRDNVLVCVRDEGLYEASVTEKKWRKIAGTDSVPPDGELVQQGPDSPLLAYYPSQGTGLPMDKKRAVLFVSEDAGKTWKQKCAGRIFEGLFIDHDGKFYAFESVGSFDADGHFRGNGNRRRLVVSKDKGATWEVLCEKLPETQGMAFAGIRLDSIFEDPDHPGRVCLTGLTFSDVASEPPAEFVFHANNAYDEWTSTDLSSWRNGAKVRPGPRNFEKGGWYEGEIQDIGPTLSNFFSMPPGIPAGTTAEMPTVKTDKAAYTFRENGPKPIQVTVMFREDYTGPGVKLLDDKDESLFWGLRARYDFRSVGYMPFDSRPPLNVTTVRKKTDDELLHDPDLQNVVVDGAHPYNREIDLDKFYNFARPGIYKLRIYHADSGLVKQSGNAGSDVFEVIITE